MFAYTIADNLYHQARNRSRWGQVWSGLRGRSRRLLSLTNLDLNTSIRTRSDAGLQTVSLEQIRGSESRGHEFDCDFNPLHCDRERWLRVALARQYGKDLPPVALIQVGDVYFVRDGHHRISVARAMGQQDIEAEVIVWQVSGSLPWEKPKTGPNLTWPKVSPERLYEKVKTGYASVQRRVLLSLSYLLIDVGMRLKAQGISK